ncbi:hypothetical protein [Ectobacillus sp. sgz5001026]|uniref:hypothetical protein n=1 Tax=Ectobacillus sp. sgz5001026 TaxID=3242473 RepID=UPI0036D2E1FF
MLNVSKIKGDNNCFRCGILLKWCGDISNSKPVGVVETPEIEYTGDLVFCDKNQVEVTVKCPRCNNKNKFIKSI